MGTSAKELCQPDAFPYTTTTGETYDVGDFARILSRAEQSADVAGYAARKAKSLSGGKLRGQGPATTSRAFLVHQVRQPRLPLTMTAQWTFLSARSPTDRGMRRPMQFLADQTGIPYEAIRVIQGDSDRIATGGSTEEDRALQRGAKQRNPLSLSAR